MFISNWMVKKTRPVRPHLGKQSGQIATYIVSLFYSLLYNQCEDPQTFFSAKHLPWEGFSLPIFRWIPPVLFASISNMCSTKMGQILQKANGNLKGSCLHNLCEADHAAFMEMPHFPNKNSRKWLMWQQGFCLFRQYEVIHLHSPILLGNVLQRRRLQLYFCPLLAYALLALSLGFLSLGASLIYAAY